MITHFHDVLIVFGPLWRLYIFGHFAWALYIAAKYQDFPPFSVHVNASFIGSSTVAPNKSLISFV